MAITFEDSTRFLLLFNMLCKIVYFIEWVNKNKWALPSGAKEQIGPKGRSRATSGSAHLFFHLTILHNILKNKRNRLDSSNVMDILRFFRPGHPSRHCLFCLFFRTGWYSRIRRSSSRRRPRWIRIIDSYRYSSKCWNRRACNGKHYWRCWRYRI